MAQTERIIYLMKTLKEGGSFSVVESANYFEVNPRTIKRDIEKLRDLYSIPIEYTGDPRHQYRLTQSEQKNLRIRLEGEGLLLFSLIQSFCRNNSLFPIHLESIKKDLGLPVDDPRLDMTRHISYEMSEQKKMNYQLFSDVLHSIDNQKQLRIIYKSLNGSESKRIIEPHHLKNTDGQWYLLAWCHLRQSLRVFHFSRIIHCVIKEEHFSVKIDDTENKDYLNKGYGVMAGKDHTHWVKLLFTGASARLVQDKQWHFKQVVKESGGAVNVSFPVESFEEILRVILSYHSDVNVLEPPELRELWIEKIEEMARNVGGGTSDVPGAGV